MVLQEAMDEAGDPGERELWRKRLFYYLDWLFQKDSNAGAEFAGLQVTFHNARSRCPHCMSCAFIDNSSSRSSFLWAVLEVCVS